MIKIVSKRVENIVGKGENAGYLDVFLFFQLAADPDQNVKNGTELLDRLIKVGTESITQHLRWSKTKVLVIILLYICDPSCRKGPYWNS